MSTLIRVIAAGVLLGFSYWTPAQSTFSIEQAVNYALQNHTNLKMVDEDILDADLQIKEYKAIGIPKLNGSAGYQHFLAIPTQIIPDFLGPAVDGRLLDYNLIDQSQVIPPSGGGFPAQFGRKNNLSAGINLDFLVFDGAYFVGLKAARLAMELARQQRGITERDITINVTKAYLGTLHIDHGKQAIQNNLLVLNKTLQETQALQKAGFAEQLDVDRLQLAVDLLARELQKLAGVESLARNVLKFQMNYPLDQDIQLTDALDPLIEQAISQPMVVTEKPDLNNRPEFIVLNSLDKLNNFNVKRLQTAYYPSLRGFASYSAALQRNKLFDNDESGWFPSSIVGLSLNVPIFDGTDKKMKVERAKVSYRKNQLQKSLLTQGVNLAAENAKVNYQNTLATLGSNDKTLQLARQILQTSKAKFTGGVGSSFEVVQAEREVYTAEANYINARYEVLMAYKELLWALGK